MRLPREIQVLLALLLVMIAGVLWYVVDRRARMRAESARPPPAPVAAQPAAPAEPVDLTQHDRQTIDFSSGRPVVRDTPADRAAIDAALKDIAAATKDVTFGPADRKPDPAKK